MRPVTGSLKTFLDNWSPMTRVAVADLYTFTLVGGEVLRYSGFTSALNAPAPTTSSPLISFPLGPLFRRNSCSIKVGTEIDELNIDILTNDTLTIVVGGTLTWQAAAWQGIFDGAYLDLQRAFLQRNSVLDGLNTYDVVGTIDWFYGRIADIDIDRLSLKMKIKSELDRLTLQMPRRLFQASCTFIFGDAMCLFDRETLSANITALGGTDSGQITTSLNPSPSNLYDNGTVISTSGENNGFSRGISRLSSGVIHFLKPWIFPIGAGETFHLLPGCDHTLNTCTNTFNNAIHFGGMPFIPPPETAV